MFAAKFITSIDRRHRGVHPMSSDVFVRGVHACRSRMSDSKLHAATIMLAMLDGQVDRNDVSKGVSFATTTAQANDRNVPKAYLMHRRSSSGESRN